MADKASSEERTISWEEIKEHNSKSKSVWVAINNKVYDVTQFMDDVSVQCQAVRLQHSVCLCCPPFSILVARKFFKNKQVQCVYSPSCHVCCRDRAFEYHVVR